VGGIATGASAALPIIVGRMPGMIAYLLGQ
jgi:hypothetical protein